MKKENKEVVKDCVVLGGSGRQWLEDKWQRRDIGHQPSHPQWATRKLRHTGDKDKDRDKDKEKDKKQSHFRGNLHVMGIHTYSTQGTLRRPTNTLTLPPTSHTSVAR